MSHLVELTDVYKIYHMGDTDVHALDGITLTIDKGEFVAIVGSSGSGKSTCMNIIGCLDVPTRGSYMLNGKEIAIIPPMNLPTYEIRCLALYSSSITLSPS